MMSIKKILCCSSLLLLSLFLASCLTETQSQQKSQSAAEESIPSQSEISTSPATTPTVGLPVQYLTPSYMVDKKAGEDLVIAEEVKLKVGARITSTRGPQPLWDIMKRLAALKDMNVSWESDVDQNVLVDVDISADDDFFVTIDNLLRQVDYHHEMQGSTIIVKYKETRQFQIAMPFIKQAYKTKTGGDVLGGGTELSSNVAGEISLSTDGVAINKHKDGKPGGIEFNTWDSIENNLNAILSIWTTEEIPSKPAGESSQPTVIIQQNTRARSDRYSKAKDNIEVTSNEPQPSATFRRSSSGNTYFIDKPVGLITVTAPRPLMDKLAAYFKALQKELYKQVAIEAKILEVQLDDSSSIGLNWHKILTNLSVIGAQLSGGTTYAKTDTDSENSAATQSNINTATNTTTKTRDKTYDFLAPDTLTADAGTSAASNIMSNIAQSTASSGVSAATVISEGLVGTLGGTVSLAAFTFDSFLNAVSQQGKATILSNPKLSVLNGQPALITVGRNVTYISGIESDVSETGVITYTAETARALSGVGLALTANILDDNQIILNLVPVTSELTEPIEYLPVGLGSVGLPIINVREMSTTVKVKDGEMLVIGGLISSAEEKDGTFIPGTSNLSFFKYLFGYETKTAAKRELIILLKPRII